MPVFSNAVFTNAADKVASLFSDRIEMTHQDKVAIAAAIRGAIDPTTAKAGRRPSPIMVFPGSDDALEDATRFGFRVTVIFDDPALFEKRRAMTLSRIDHAMMHSERRQDWNSQLVDSLFWTFPKNLTVAPYSADAFLEDDTIVFHVSVDVHDARWVMQAARKNMGYEPSFAEAVAFMIVDPFIRQDAAACGIKSLELSKTNADRLFPTPAHA